MKWFSIYFLCFSLSWSEKDLSQDCSKLTQYIKSELQIYNNKKISVYKPIKTRMLFEDIEGMQTKTLSLGIGNEGHFYLLIGDQRIDGAYFPFPSKQVRSFLSNGYVLKLNVEEKVIEEWLAKNKPGVKGFYLSCVDAACSILKKDFDIEISQTAYKNIFLKNNFEKIFSEGFRHTKTGKAVPFEVYQITQKVKPLGEWVSRLKKMDWAYGIFGVGYWVGAIWLTASGIYMVILWVD